MKQSISSIIKKLISGWDFMRTFRLILSISMFFGYLSSKENIYLIGALFLGFQAVFNLGCPGATCQTSVKESEIKPVQFKELELKDDKKDVQ